LAGDRFASLEAEIRRRRAEVAGQRLTAEAVLPLGLWVFLAILCGHGVGRLAGGYGLAATGLLLSVFMTVWAIARRGAWIRARRELRQAEEALVATSIRGVAEPGRVTYPHGRVPAGRRGRRTAREPEPTDRVWPRLTPDARQAAMSNRRAAGNFRPSSTTNAHLGKGEQT
jgi:hypothetical protein